MRFHWSVYDNYCHTGPIYMENLEIAVSKIKCSLQSTCPNVKITSPRYMGPHLFWPLLNYIFSLVEQDQDGQR